MAYIVRVMSPVEREERIRAALEAAEGEQTFYDFRSKPTKLKVVRIDIDVPIYRMENFRTFTQQKEAIVREGKPQNYFQANQENESVQQTQHDILVALAKKGAADSLTVTDVLRREKQREELLITSKGVVVNGNRRLAAMRELYEESRTANAEFTHVDCMVLPADATAKEIVEIEASLQAKPDVKLEYDWIGDGQLIKRLIALGQSPTEIASRYNRREKEVRNALQALTEAELYLRDWAKAEGEYSRVANDGEQFFKDLPTLLNGKDAGLQEASRAIGWTLFDNRDALGERLYAFNVVVGKRAPDVIDRFANELGLPLDEVAEATDQDFELEFEEDRTVGYAPVVEALRDPARREEAVETLIDVSRSVIELERNQKSANAALKAVSTAHAKLSEVDLTRASKASYAAIGKQLEAIASRTANLRRRLEALQSNSAAPTSE